MKKALDKRQETFLENSPKIRMLTIADDHWKNGVRYAVDAIAQLVKEGYPIEYKILGEESEELRYQIVQLGLVNDVFILPRPSSLVQQFYLEAADVFLDPNLEEPSLDLISQAIKLKTLVFHTNESDRGQNLYDENTSFVIKKRSAKSIVSEIKKVAHKFSTRKSLL